MRGAKQRGGRPASRRDWAPTTWATAGLPALRVAYRMVVERPPVLGGLMLGAGYRWAHLRRTPQVPDHAARRALRDEQRTRLRLFARGRRLQAEGAPAEGPAFRAGPAERRAPGRHLQPLSGCLAHVHPSRGARAARPRRGCEHVRGSPRRPRRCPVGRRPRGAGEHPRDPAGGPELARAHLRALLRHPRAWAGTLLRALRLTPGTPRGTLWQLFYFAEAVSLWDELRAPRHPPPARALRRRGERRRAARHRPGQPR